MAGLRSIAIWLAGVCLFGGLKVLMGVITEAGLWVTGSVAFSAICGWSLLWAGREGFWGDDR